MKTDGRPMTIKGPQPIDGNPTDDAMALLGGARGMTQTRTQFQTAVTVQKPRSLEALRKACMQEASYSRENFTYAWTVADKNSDSGKSLIEGLSIDGAMILLRNWGNAVCEPTLVDETPTHWMMSATFIDLETGFTSSRLFRQRKSQSTGRMDAERSLDIQFQIGQSKAIRNAIARSIPQWLVDESIEAAKASAAERYKNVAEHAARAIESYKKDFQVSVEQLERKLGKKQPDWIPADVVLLRAIFKGLKEGQTSVGQEFSADEPVTAAPAEASPPSTPELKVDADGRLVETSPTTSSDSKPKSEAAVDTRTEEENALEAERAEAEKAFAAREAAEAAAAAASPTPAVEPEAKKGKK